MRESHLRSVLKGLSWRIFGTVLTALIVLFITHKFQTAIYISCFEFFSKIIFFYFHERVWQLIPLGFAKASANDRVDYRVEA